MKKASAVSVATLLAAAGAASAQISPTGPFTGPYTESFETQVAQQFSQCIQGRLFDNTADLCDSTGTGAHITTGWTFMCTIFPHSSGHFSGSAGGPYQLTFDVPVNRFGGYFGTNSGTDGAVVTFYDDTNAVIGTQDLTTAGCDWTWNGWESTVPIKKMLFVGNNPWGGGFIDMDDLEYQIGGTGPTGACCRPNGACILSTASGCNFFGGIYRGDNTVCATANCPAGGACCLPTLTCATLTSAACTAQSGTFRGDNTSCATANCPTPGACCLSDGTCTQTSGSGCTTAGGIYRGDSTVCASANCPIPQDVWVEQGDAGDFMETANVTRGPGPLHHIRGTLSADDADMYAFRLCDPVNFSASTVGGTAFNTQLFLFNASGLGIVSDDDTASSPQSALTSAFTASQPAGIYFIAVSAYDKDPVDSGALQLWDDEPFELERAPDGPGAANPIATWDSGGGATGAYSIAMTGSCFAEDQGSTCYANCDASTTQPCLNVLDFTCFLNQFAAGATYANCDASTTPPVLNVLDFTCFLNRFAAGCSGC